jgi:hypothetical protein
VLSPPHLLPSSALLESGYPAALPQFVLQRVPSRPISTPTEPQTHEEKVDLSGADKNSKPASNEKKPSEASKVLANTLASMDVRNLKWMWSGLTFNKGSSSSKSAPASITPLHPSATPPAQPQEAEEKPGPSRTETEVEVDRESLQDAMESDSIHLSARTSPASTSPLPLAADKLSDSLEEQEVHVSDIEQGRGHNKDIVVKTEAVTEEEHGFIRETAVGHDSMQPVSGTEPQDMATTPLTAKPPFERPAPPAFFSAPVFLSEFGVDEPTTTRKRVYHATVSSFFPVCECRVLTLCAERVAYLCICR